MIFEKYKKNPLISPLDVKPSIEGYQVLGTFNPGAALYKNEIILLLRVAENCVQEPEKIRVPVYKFKNGIGVAGIEEFAQNDSNLVLKDTRGVVYRGKDYLSSASHIRLARSADGINFTVDESPFIFPCLPEEKYGVEDARAVFIDGRYYINYTVVSEDGWCTMLSVTDDFKTHKRLGVIFHPQNKDVCIFPEKVNGKYIALHRPNNDGFGKPSIWYAESPDLLHWGKHRCVARPRGNVYESKKIGGGCSPVRTDEGWLCIYHGKGEGDRYSLFALLLDLDEPWRVLKRSKFPLLVPDQIYETKGFFPGVVFTNGIVMKGNEIYMYYGSADENTCLAVSTTDKVLSSLDS